MYKAEELVGKTFYRSLTYSGEQEDGVKNKRPHYILRKYGEDKVIVVKSTKTKNTGQKKTYKGNIKYVEYVAPDGQPAWLRKDAKYGYDIISIKEINDNISDLTSDIKLTEGQHKDLNYFYSDYIIA